MVRKRKVMHAPKFLLLIVIMKRGRDIASFFAPVNKKGRETNQSIERVEEQEEGEPEESVEVGERACDESEGSDTEREIPEGEEHEEEGEEEENIQGQRGTESGSMWIKYCTIRFVMKKVLTICKAVQL